MMPTSDEPHRRDTKRLESRSPASVLISETQTYTLQMCKQIALMVG